MKYELVSPPPLTWQMQFGDDPYCVTYKISGKGPNWFWRKMQHLCFGFVWTKL